MPAAPLALAAASLAILTSLVGDAHGEPRRYSTPEIEALNAAFRAAYASARDDMVRQAGPLVLATGDRLTLLHGGKRLEGRTVHPNYHDLKTLAHVPLAVFCLARPLVSVEADDLQLHRLVALRDATARLEDDLHVAFPDNPQRERQLHLLQVSTELMDWSIEHRRLTPERLDAFTEHVRPAVLQNTTDAVKLRVDNYHDQLLDWRSQIDDNHWRRLTVIVPGAALPRAGSLAVAYFAKVLEQNGESDRLIYAESLFEEPQALQLLGTHRLDAQIGRAFFDDASRMKRDLLGPVARVYLDSLDFDAFRLNDP